MNFLVFLRLGIIKKWNEIVALIRKSFIEFCAWFHIVCVCVHFTSFNNRRPLTFEKFGTALIPLAYSVWGWVGVGGDYGPPLHNSVFWGVFLGLQPSGAAARLCVPAEWFGCVTLAPRTFAPTYFGTFAPTISGHLPPPISDICPSDICPLDICSHIFWDICTHLL